MHASLPEWDFTGLVGRIEGHVRFAQSGQPLPGVEVSAPGSRGGSAPTNDAGWYVLTCMPPGEREIVFRCPTKTIRGKILARRTVKLEPHETLMLDLDVEPGVSFEPPWTSFTGVFSGLFFQGDEMSWFIPTGHAIFTPTGERRPVRQAWLTLPSPARPSRRTPPLSVEEALRRFASTYVLRVRGMICGPGIYGHMGASDYDLRVEDILDMTPLPLRFTPFHVLCEDLD